MKLRIRKVLALLALVGAGVAGCDRSSSEASEPAAERMTPAAGSTVPAAELSATTSGAANSKTQDQKRATAVFAGGCFWCMEPPFEKLEGVVSVTSGYTGGDVRDPTYKQVSGGDTGHAEAVRIVFDPSTVSYQELLDVFWRNIDPTQSDGQFCDHGPQYRSAIFALNAEQERIAQQSREQVAKKLDEPIVTQVHDASKFWIAEQYHQDYYKKNPLRYKYYRYSCGRDERLD